MPSPEPMPGTLLVISGASGVGKSTVVARLLEQVAVHFSVSATTREARPHEIDGVHYHFVTHEQFQRRIDDGDMLEWAEYSGNLYGTPKRAVLDQLSRGNIVLLDIENQGALAVKDAYPESVTIFLAPPSMEELRERLARRGDTSIEDMEMRLAVAELQLAHARDRYDAVVVNDDVDRVTAEIMRILAVRERGNDAD